MSKGGKGRKDRRYAKRTTRALWRRYERDLETILTLKDMFGDTHPEHSKLLDLLAQNTLICQGMVEDFYRVTWGSIPDSWDSDV